MNPESRLRSKERKNTDFAICKKEMRADDPVPACPNDGRFDLKILK
jgi:hypothetical protein